MYMWPYIAPGIVLGDQRTLFPAHVQLIKVYNCFLWHRVCLLWTAEFLTQAYTCIACQSSTDFFYFVSLSALCQHITALVLFHYFKYILVTLFDVAGCISWTVILPYLWVRITVPKHRKLFVNSSAHSFPFFYTTLLVPQPPLPVITFQKMELMAIVL